MLTICASDWSMSRKRKLPMLSFFACGGAALFLRACVLFLSVLARSAPLWLLTAIVLRLVLLRHEAEEAEHRRQVGARALALAS